MQHIRKFIQIVFMVFLICFTLVGCGDIPESLQANISNAFRERADANLVIVDELYSSGVISKETRDLLAEDIKNNLQIFGESIKTTDSEDSKNLLKSLVDWRVVPDPEYPGTIGDKDWCMQFLTNYMVWGSANSSFNEHTVNSPILGGNSQVIKPIEVLSESTIEQMNNELSVPIYVLRTNINNETGLDGIIEAVKVASDSKSEIGLSTYFEAATYKNDKGEQVPLTLLDTTDESEMIVRVSSGSANAPEPYKLSTTRDPYTQTALTCNYTNVPGKDMIISMSGEPIMAVRILEFNREAVDKLSEEIGINNSRYLVLNGKAYLMEYNVGYISGFMESEDRHSYNSIIEQSNIGFNLLTKKFSKFTVDSSGNITNDSVEVSSEDPYLTYDGALSNTDESKASLVVYKDTGVSDESRSGDDIDEICNPDWNISIGTYTDSSNNKADRVVNMGRIVLRDYLEATYAPGVIANENLVVLGRKLRILQLSGDKSNVVARFYDKEGNLLGDDSAKLFIDDFADIGLLLGSDASVNYISRTQESLGSLSVGTETSSGDSDSVATSGDNGTETSSGDSDSDSDSGATSGDGGALKDSLSKIDKLTKNIVNKIEVSVPFPGVSIGRSDLSYSDEKPQFYAMAVKASMFETGLFSGWVKSTDSTKNSTAWWNSWLGKHGYNYSINSDNLINYLKGNYAYDLSQEGVIILDLETIGKIQDEYNQDIKIDTSHGIRTIFILVGYALVAYSVILLIAWNVDVNVDLGLNILERMTLGRWVAVKDLEELPSINTDETVYMNFKQLLVSSIIMIAFGIILISINIIDLILILIGTFGGLARYISNMITGVG